ncbi:hypothetical protein MMC30_004986 [Trapelia coarctata]|nr:hypothetical protein [Trapelia coarctata]
MDHKQAILSPGGGTRDEERQEKEAWSTKSQARLSNPHSSKHSSSETSNNKRPHAATPHTGSGYTPTRRASTPSISSYPASLGYFNVDQHRAQSIHSAIPTRDTLVEDAAALKITMEGLGIELPDTIIADLAKKHDGMTPMERFLAEEGYWVPGSRSQGTHGDGITREAEHSGRDVRC